MALLGTLQVRMGLDTATFTQGFSRFQRGMKKRIGKFQRSMRGLTNIGGLVGSAGLIGGFKKITSAAFDFSDVMLDVEKNVKGLNKLNTKSLEVDILTLGANSFLGAKGMARLVSEAGKLGEGIKGAKEFAKLSEEIAVGFDFGRDLESAQVAGGIIGTLRSGLKLTTGEVRDLADSINFFGDNTASNAKDITDIIVRQGALLASTTNLTKEEIAGLSATIDATADSPEMAATAMKNLVLALTLGKSATKQQSRALKELGLDAGSMAKAMQKDAAGSIIKVLEAIEKLKAEEKAGVLKSLFGKQSVGAIAPLLLNLDELKKNLATASKKETFLGSLRREFDRLNESDNGKILKAIASISVAMIRFGKISLPIVASLFQKMGELAKPIGLFAKEHPKLIKVGFAFAGILAVLGPVGFALSGLAGLVPVITGAFGLLSIGLLKPLGSFGLLSKAGGLLGKAFAIPAALKAFPALFGKLGAGLSGFLLKLAPVKALMIKLGVPFVMMATKLAGFKLAIAGVGGTLLTRLLGPVKFLGPIFGKFGTVLGGLAARFGFMGGAGALFGRGLLTLVGGPVGLAITAFFLFKDEILGFVKAAGPAIMGFIERVKQWFSGWLANNQGVLSALSDAWTALKDAGTKLGAALFVAFDKIKTAFAAAFSGDGLSSAINWGDVFSTILTGAVKGLTFVITKLAEFVTWLSVKIPPAVDAVLEFLKPFFDFITTAFTALAETVNGQKSVWETLGEVIGAAVATIWKLIKSAFTKAADFLASIDWGQLGKDIINGLIAGIKEAVPMALQAIKDLAAGLKNGLMGEWKMRSPSKVFAKLGGYLVDGLVKGIDAARTRADGAATRLAAGVKGAFAGGIGGMGGGLSGLAGRDNFSQSGFGSVASQYVPERAQIVSKYAKEREMILAEQRITETQRTELLKSSAEKRNTALQGMASAADAFKTKWANAIGGLKGLVSEFAQSGKVSLGSMINLALEFVKTMMASKIASAAGGGGGVGGGWVGLIASLASSFGGARGNGGNVSGNKSYLVGENGPEVFNPKRNGQIIPSDKLAKASAARGDGSVVHETYNIAPGVTRLELRVTLEEMERQREISQAQRYRNGDVRTREMRY